MASSMDSFHDFYFQKLQVQENRPIVRGDWLIDILFLKETNISSKRSPSDYGISTWVVKIRNYRWAWVKFSEIQWELQTEVPELKFFSSLLQNIEWSCLGPVFMELPQIRHFMHQ